MTSGAAADPARKTIIIDGKPLIDDHFSGVGHYAAGLLGALDDLLGDRPDLDVAIAAPVRRLRRLAPFGFRRIRTKPIYLTLTAMRRLVVAGRLPPMDLVLGRGTYFFPDFAPWPLARSRSVTAIHDLSFEVFAEFADPGNAAFLSREIRNAAAHSERITALTATMADEISTALAFDRSRIDVVGCAADLSHFYRRPPEEVARVTRHLGIFGDYVLAVGNIEPRKNQVRLIDAFCATPAARDLTLVLVGAGAWNEAAIRARVDQALADGFKVQLLLGRVTDEDMPALYSGATCSAYVSVYEGFGMPPLESMACQTPVVSSTSSVMPEVAGGAAVLVDVQSTDAIRDGLQRMLSLDPSERADLVARGLANVDRYDWRDSAVALLDSLDRAESGR